MSAEKEGEEGEGEEPEERKGKPDLQGERVRSRYDEERSHVVGLRSYKREEISN